jgi:hypothetical protein
MYVQGGVEREGMSHLYLLPWDLGRQLAFHLGGLWNLQGSLEASDYKSLREAFFQFIMFNQLSEGHRDSDLLDLMLEVKRRCRLWNFFYFRNMIVDSGREGLSLLTSVTVGYLR